MVDDFSIGIRTRAFRLAFLLLVCVLPLTVLVGCSGCGASEEADEDSYLDLQRRLAEGESIHVDSQRRTVSLGTERSPDAQSEQPVDDWLEELGSSPGMRNAVREFQPSQRDIVRAVRELDRELGTSGEVAGAVVRFYAGHQLSPDPEIRDTAFDELRKKRVIMKDFAPVLEEQDREALREFVRSNPTFGTGDAGFGLQNAIANLGAAGHSRESIKLLKSLEGKVPEFELSRQAALARMGEKQYEADLIDRYGEAPAGREKASLAAALGYISTDTTLSVLAADLRSDESFNGAGFNQYVLGALTMSPEWTNARARYTRLGVYDQEDFDVAEAWSKERFGTEWDQPPPPVRQLVPRKFN